MTSYLVAVPPAVLDAAEASGERKNRVWRTDRFTSSSPILRGLEGGGTLFVVSVSLLGFVHMQAVLKEPRYQDGAWVSAKKNVVPFGDVPMAELSFMKGAEHSIDKRFKRTLLTPHPLTDQDVVVLGGAPPGVELGNLRVVSSARPAVIGDLDGTQKNQLRAAGLGHDGKNLSAEARLAPRPGPREPDPGESFAGDLEILRIADETGTVLYDVFVCGPDSGAVFRTKTTATVAELIQGGVECKDAALKERLRRALITRPAKDAAIATVESSPRKPAKKPAARKPEAKRPVVKKSAAKKPIVKKPAAKKPAAKKPAAKKPAASKSKTMVTR